MFIEAHSATEAVLMYEVWPHEFIILYINVTGDIIKKRRKRFWILKENIQPYEMSEYSAI